ncbi:MAG: hypothetical protein H7289_07335 [Mucilaginibacter sp.]|nr:hypothetical protein [Mucilaginibacter sp.]
MSIMILLEAACFLIAFITLKREASWAWRGMVIFLLITCITEITGKFLKSVYHNNQWVYNIFFLFELGFTSTMFNHIFSKYINSKLLIICSFGLLITLYVYDIISHGFLVYIDLSATVMAVVFVLYSFYYFYLLIKDDHYVDLKRSAAFWWVAGVLFYYFGSTAVNLFFVYLKNVRMFGHNVTHFIFMALSFILYSCWGYSFICRKWHTTSNS